MNKRSKQVLSEEGVQAIKNQIEKDVIVMREEFRRWRQSEDGEYKVQERSEQITAFQEMLTKCTISSVGDHPVSSVEDHLIS